MKRITLAGLLLGLLLAGCSEEQSPADRVYLNGVVYTADASRRVVSALAVRGERIIYVGDDAGARELVDENSEVLDLQGRMVLPGLHDMHIHPAGLIEPEAGLSADRMPAIAEVLARNGLTSIQDAALMPELVDAYKSLVDNGDMSFRLSVAVLQDVPDYKSAGGTIDVAAMVKDLEALRERYRRVPYIQVESARIFVDGVIEGNPRSNPPTLPNAAVINNYRQPVFALDMENEKVEITAYVDLASQTCQRVRLAPDVFLKPRAIKAFARRHGYHPGQCRISRGVLEHPASFIKEYMRALDEAGFNIHARVIGDRAVRTALDGFDFARAENGPLRGRHSLGHIQLVAPEDYARIGEHKLYLVFTYAWMAPQFFYDLTVNPFIDRLADIGDLYNPDSYLMSNVYPAAQLRDQGAILAAGSDAPVDVRDPRPFFNIQQAITRANERGEVLNPAARISIEDALDAYTINGARLFGHDAQTGSLEPGKLADLVVIDRDLLSLSRNGRANEIAQTRVLQTLFEGRSVY